MEALEHAMQLTKWEDEIQGLEGYGWQIFSYILISFISSKTCAWDGCLSKEGLWGRRVEH